MIVLRKGLIRQNIKKLVNVQVTYILMVHEFDLIPLKTTLLITEFLLLFSILDIEAII